VVYFSGKTRKIDHLSPFFTSEASKNRNNFPQMLDIFNQKKFHIQGHRGARGLLPENTIESCLEALKWGVDGLEIDVVVSKDGQIVVSHEPWMSTQICSFPDGKPVITEGLCLLDMDYADIKKYDCGLRGHPKFRNQKAIKCYKPTLYDLMNAVNKLNNVQYHIEEPDKTHEKLNTVQKKNNVQQIVEKPKKPFFNIEIKSLKPYYRKYVPTPNEFVHLLKGPLSKMPENSFYISSFDPQVLRVVKREMPKIPIAFLTENKISLALNIRRLGFIPDMYSPYYRFMSLKTVKKAHQMGMKVVTWTVNDVKIALKLKNWGVDGIITDYPNLNCEL
jgi:glycerophosphoryl diester phosphodiesterase